MVDLVVFGGVFIVYMECKSSKGNGQTLLGDAAGWSYPFVFKFHVPLFFLFAGCTEYLSKETDTWKSILKKVKRIKCKSCILLICRFCMLLQSKYSHRHVLYTM